MDITNESASSDRPSSKLASYLRQARNSLIQTGTRNRLIHTARFGKRGKYIDIVDERSEDVFRILVSDGKSMRFDHDPDDAELPEEGEPKLLTYIKEVGEGRYTDDLLQTKFGQDRLQKKLLGIARDAKTLEEEQGINALYLTLGFLRWYESPTSEMVREAPLILLPVSLRRNDRKSTYQLEFRGDDITTNEPLSRRLKEDFGIGLPEIPEDEEWSPDSYFRAVRVAIQEQARWKIDQDGMQLGFFSFAKLLMVRDLEPENWPDNSILNHPIISGLLLDGFESEEELFPDQSNLDALFEPSDLVQVLDADASQTLVIESVRKGRNLVVKGPPGTGKSQTITNIIASAVHDGKTVLFVAEKMAALNVVHSRLLNAGLQNVCLELHSRAANKRTVAQELGRTLEFARSAATSDAGVAELKNLRDQLNRIAETAHAPIGDTDISPYRAVSTLVRLRESGFRPVDYAIPSVETWTRDRLKSALQAAADLSAIGSRAGAKVDHPFFGVHRKTILPSDVERFEALLKELSAALVAAQETAGAVTRGLGVAEVPSTSRATAMSDVLTHISNLSSGAERMASLPSVQGDLERAGQLAEFGLKFKQTDAAARPLFKPLALDTQIDHLRPMLATGHSFFGRLGSRYRAASAELDSLTIGPLPKSQSERLALMEQLQDWQSSYIQLAKREEFGRQVLGELWLGPDTEFENLSQAVSWLRQLLEMAVNVKLERAVSLRRHEPSQLARLGKRVADEAKNVASLSATAFDQLELDVEEAFGVSDSGEVAFEALDLKVDTWLKNLGRLDEWLQLVGALEKVDAIVGQQLGEALAAGAIQPEDVASTIRYVHAESLYRRFAEQHQWMLKLTSDQKTELVSSFRQREVARWGTNAQLIRASHADGVPTGGMGAMGFIKGEIARKRGHKPLRTLVKRAGPALQQLKPVLLMSPISVAQFATPGAIEFDLLVIDEASQVRPEDAIGAIARSKQIVVVGDRQQLPPTSFFDRVVADQDDLDEDEESAESDQPSVTSATELESILTLCEARGLNTRMLEWHYRSRHPSLIEVSNENFYENRLVLFPSPAAGEDKTDGLRMHRVDGAYDRGGKRNNTIEAKEIAKAVALHARQYPERSLGVVAFSSAQRDHITYWLDLERQGDDELDNFMREGSSEEFFVKSIENVQGDERDVIFVSVGYGPRQAGHRLDSMAFGPVSSEHGERRLNVLFTRARFKTEVFCSFDAGDIDVSRTRNRGALVLKQFLYAAQNGSSKPPVILDADPDSDFEVSVAEAIRSLGYEADYQVGSAGYKIDIAVRNPNSPSRFMLAVECDGARYHSAIWARERDRQRQDVLEGLGWAFHRVWSTDWYHRRDDELRRLQTALERASNETSAVQTPEPPAAVTDTKPIPDSEDSVARIETVLPEYVVADFQVDKREEPHMISVGKMSETVARIIEAEGPIHRDEIARRVAGLFGRQRTGSRITEAVYVGLRHLASKNGEITADGYFWRTREQGNDVPLRNRSEAPLSLRKADMIPPLEIAEAIHRVLAENGALAVQDVPRAVAQLFGFSRTGPEFRPAVEPVALELISNGLVIETDAGLVSNK